MQSTPSSPSQPAAEHAGGHNPRWVLIVPLFAILAHGATSVFLAEHPLLPDEREYLALGRSIAETGALESPQGDRARRMPLYPVLLSLELRDAPPEALPTGVIVIQSVTAWSTTLIIMGLGFLLADIRAGVFAGLISALYQPFLLVQNSYLTESFTIFLLFAAIFAYLRFGILATNRAEQLFALGLTSTCVAMATLLRANALLFIIPFILDTTFRRSMKRGMATRLIVLFAPVIVVAATWSARNAVATHRWTLSTGGGLNFYLGHNADYSTNPSLAHSDYAAFDRIRKERGWSEAQVDRYLYRQGARFICDHPVESAVNVCRKTAVWLGTTLPYCGPILPIFATLTVLSGFRASPVRHACAPKRRRVIKVILWASLAGFVGYYAWYLTEHGARFPFVSSRDLVIWGIVSLALFRPRVPAKRLLVGLFVTQFAVAIVFVPLVRIRWVVDGLLIVALAVALSNVCDWLGGDQRKSKPAM